MDTSFEALGNHKIVRDMQTKAMKVGGDCHAAAGSLTVEEKEIIKQIIVLLDKLEVSVDQH